MRRTHAMRHATCRMSIPCPPRSMRSTTWICATSSTCSFPSCRTRSIIGTRHVVRSTFAYTHLTTRAHVQCAFVAVYVLHTLTTHTHLRCTSHAPDPHLALRPEKRRVTCSPTCAVVISCNMLPL